MSLKQLVSKDWFNYDNTALVSWKIKLFVFLGGGGDVPLKTF